MTGAAFRRARRPDVLARLAGTERRSWRDAWRSPPSLFVARVVDVELPVSLDDAWRVWRLATPVAALVVAAVMGPVPAALVVVAACAAPFVVVALARSRSAAAYDADLVVALDAIGRGVRSGASLGQAIGEAAGTVRGLRFTSTCCGIDYARLASGEADHAVYHRTKPWDHAPGSLLLREAGGVVGDPGGRPYRPQDAEPRWLVSAADATTYELVRGLLPGSR